MAHTCMCALTNEEGKVWDRCIDVVENPDSPICDACIRAGHDSLPHLSYIEVMREQRIP